ncbi:NAD(P)/FAD-dependent oxidoreductase [Lacisediminihabitans sp.]|uniref:NAD(P)/FAD-dependent oxidoreductase n=1 Tax=Lacisediminihabitans sp. TaxID=2787631 RepID=UPI00374DF1FE
MTSQENFIIVGGGLAGASAAEALRAGGFEGSIRLFAGERHHPYIRPPLSKDYLSGKDAIDTVFVHPHDWYGENGVEVSTGSPVASLDPAARSVTLADGERVGYDALLLATGSTPRRLPIAGADLDGVHYLRTIDDSEALRAELQDGGRRLVLIGSGWIGMEVAATARTLGNEVTILEREAIPLAAALGDELGTMFAEMHLEHGVTLRRQVVVDSIVGAGGRVTGVVLADGESIPADLVLVGIGAVPNVGLATSAGLETDNGVLTDAALHTSDQHIFAAGDVANAFHPVIGRRLRSEHWANALGGGAAAGRSMLGETVSYDDIPYFYTDQFDLGMEYSGYGPLTTGATVVYRGDRAKREFIAFWVADGKVVAGMNVNVWDVNEAVQGIIRRANTVDPARLADESVPLESL